MTSTTTTEPQYQQLIAELMTLAGSPSHAPYVERVPVRLKEAFEGKDIIPLDTWLVQAALGNLLAVKPLSPSLDPTTMNQEVIESGFHDQKTIQQLANLGVESGLFTPTKADVGLSPADLIVQDPSLLGAANAFREKYLSTFAAYVKEDDPDPISVRLIELAHILKTNGYSPS